MQRTIANLPESVSELCLVRLGLIVKRWTAWPFVLRIARAIDREVAKARAADSGMLHSERLLIGWGHFGVWQYWRSFDAMEAWSHRAPHSEWWREAVNRLRRRDDFGIYHESYLVQSPQIESIYLSCPPIGLATFGEVGEPVGPMTTSRGRLGRRSPRV